MLSCPHGFISHLFNRCGHVSYGYHLCLCFATSALVMGLDTEGGKLKIYCPSSSISYGGFENNSDKTVYNFTASCTLEAEITAYPPMKFSITGTWNKNSKIAVEEFVAPGYGSVRRVAVCNERHDPWPDPNTPCTITATDVTEAQPHMVYPVDMLAASLVSNGIFPYSERAALGYQNAVIEKVMAQSVAISLPKMNANFTSPNQALVAVEMYRPVSRELIPNMAMLIKVTETGWPDPNGPEENTNSSRTLSLVRELSHTASGPLAYFPMDGQDIWGSTWSVRAHLIVADPTWSDPILFSVEPKDLSNMHAPKIKAQPLEAPQILEPRHNRTYRADENIPLKISFDPDSDLHVEFSYKAAGSADFHLFYEKVVTVQDAKNDGNPGFWTVGGGLAGLALLQDEIGKTDIKIQAWVSKTDTSQADVSSVARLEYSQLTTSILLDKLIVTAPEEDTKFISPAQVTLSIPFTYKGLDFDVEKFVEMEVEFKGHDGVQPVASYFIPYADASFTASRTGITVYINYSLQEVGLYRFRARFAFPAEGSFPTVTTPWTEWRQLEVTGLVPSTGKPLLPPSMNPKVVQQIDADQLQTLKSQKLSVKQLALQQKMKISQLDMPVFVQPQQLEQLQRGVVRFKVKGLKDAKKLDWQLEYKGFDTPRYRKKNMNGSGIKVNDGFVTGMFQTAREGDYRIRVRSNTKGSRWSSWRMFRVGAAKGSNFILKPEEPAENVVDQMQNNNETKPQILKPKTMKPQNKPTMPSINNKVKPLFTN